MHASALLQALFLDLEPADGSDLRSFLKTHGPRDRDDPVASALGEVRDAAEDPFARLVRVAIRADRRSAATVAGHQAAMRRLFPALPEAAVAAFCVSEEGGAHPSRITTRLQRTEGEAWLLDGRKKWGTLSQDSDLLTVAASLGRRDDGRNDLRMVLVPADRKGVTIEAMPTHPALPELRHADITFDSVEIKSDEVLDGDAYLTAIKPFRLVEDVYNTAALQVALFALGRRHDWDQTTLEDLLAAILLAEGLSRTNMESDAEVLAITSYLRGAENLWNGLGDCWQRTPEVERARWGADIGLLGVAAKAREIRRQRAWTTLQASA